MKRIFILLLMFAAPHTWADCLDTWFRYNSPELYLSADYSEGCYQGNMILSFAKNIKGERQWPSQNTQWTSVPFDVECQMNKSKKEGKVFTCRKDGVSPLAGATYQYEEIKENYKCEDGSAPLPRLLYRCISGCGPNTPKELNLEYSEGQC